MTIKRVYKSTVPALRYILKDGFNCVFIDGKYITDIELHIKELDEEIGTHGRNKSRNPYMYIDTDEKEIDTEAPTALDIIKQRAKDEARAELLAEQAAAQKDMGTTGNGAVLGGIGNTGTIAALDPSVPNKEVITTIDHDAPAISTSTAADSATAQVTEQPKLVPTTDVANTATLNPAITVKKA